MSNYYVPPMQQNPEVPAAVVTQKKSPVQLIVSVVVGVLLLALLAVSTTMWMSSKSSLTKANQSLSQTRTDLATMTTLRDSVKTSLTTATSDVEKYKTRSGAYGLMTADYTSCLASLTKAINAVDGQPGTEKWSVFYAEIRHSIGDGMVCNKALAAYSAMPAE